MNKINYIFEKLCKDSLIESESDFIARKIINKDIDDVQIASILTLFYAKGESFEEIHSFIKFLKMKMKKLSLQGEIMDTCGTGGDSKNSFNFSTATSILLSSCDVKIAKHGNRSVTSKSGSFDVLEALGVKISLSEKKNKKFFKKHNICFLFAPLFHPTLKDFGLIRKSLPFRTIFNLLGPLLNPVKLDYQLLGVSHDKYLETHAKCISKQKLKNAWVVYNTNGYDELTTVSKNLFIEIKNGKIKKRQILDPKELGFKYRNENELRGGSASENSFLMRRVFEGETGALRDNVLLNSAAALLIHRKVKTIKEGIKFAENKIDSGEVLNKLLSISK
ncbi:MAG: anthranilate phosphoribosyltransferase [Alphaproteobacteria bacterium]